MGKLLLGLTLLAFPSGVLLCNVGPNLTDTANSTLVSLNETEVRNSRVSRASADSMRSTTRGGCVNHMWRTDYVITADMGAYKLHTRSLDWYQARKSCTEEGGQLVIINSQEEATMLQRWLRTESRVTGTWLGVHDLFVEGEWVTLAGETLEAAGYDKWQKGEPNNLGFLRGEHCGYLGKYADGINDEDCYIDSPYFCKIYIC
ncbi:hemolymph lipopolysaccharide-binding protein-like [Andrena cerasifolii]|uniref:hemolymph lipopolysaccharide-binding protein-like n=1 Tax=Andrena cerasifolii TaxID=2819439 RepID=UPI004037E152